MSEIKVVRVAEFNEKDQLINKIIGELYNISNERREDVKDNIELINWIIISDEKIIFKTNFNKNITTDIEELTNNNFYSNDWFVKKLNNTKEINLWLDNYYVVKDDGTEQILTQEEARMMIIVYNYTKELKQIFGSFNVDLVNRLVSIGDNVLPIKIDELEKIINK